jgi:hypothetical protein
MTFHHDLCVGQVCKIPGTAAMVGMRMGVDHVLEPKTMIRRYRDVAAGVFPQGIDQGGAPSALSSDHVGFAFSTIEFTKEHERSLHGVPFRKRLSYVFDLDTICI